MYFTNVAISNDNILYITSNCWQLPFDDSINCNSRFATDEYSLTLYSNFHNNILIVSTDRLHYIILNVSFIQSTELEVASELKTFINLLEVLLYVHAIFLYLLLLSMDMSSADKEYGPSDVSESIDCLQFTLHQNYLIAEKLMSLRQPSTTELNKAFAKIDKLYIDLVSALSDSKVDSEIAAAASKNKIEFDVHKKEWLAKISDPCSSSGANNPVTSKSKSSRTHSSSGTSVKSLNSSRSSKSSALSVKRLNAQIELKIAQLEADHLKDRIEEENVTLVLQQQMHQQNLEMQQKIRQHEMIIQQRESLRKIELAKQKYDALSEVDSFSVKSQSIYSSKVTKDAHSSKLSKPFVTVESTVSIGQAEFHPSSSSCNVLNTSNVINYCKSESRQPYPPLQTSTVSIGRNEKIQRPELVGGQPLCATSVSTVSRGRVDNVQRPGPVEKSYVTKPTPNANITPLTVSMHSEVSNGRSVLENHQGTTSNQVGNFSLYGSGFANLENDQFF